MITSPWLRRYACATYLKVLFVHTSTHATAHRMCGCAHMRSQLILCNMVTFVNVKYCSRAIISHFGFEAALDYIPRVLAPKGEKLSVILTSLQYKPQ